MGMMLSMLMMVMLLVMLMVLVLVLVLAVALGTVSLSFRRTVGMAWLIRGRCLWIATCPREKGQRGTRRHRQADDDWAQLVLMLVLTLLVLLLLVLVLARASPRRPSS